MLTFLPHCTHALQQLDCAVFASIEQALFSIYVTMFYQHFIEGHISNNARNAFEYLKQPTRFISSISQSQLTQPSSTH